MDAHSHLTMPGGAHWIDRASDPTEALLDAAEANARLLTRAGVRWARDVGSVTRPDPEDGGRARAVAIRVRERWRGRPGYPHVRAAGTWIMAKGLLPALSVEAANADELLAAAIGQLDDGADLVKLYLDGPDPGVSPWTAGELRRVVEAVHARGRAGDRPQRVRGGRPRGRGGRRRCPRARLRAGRGDRASIMAANGVRLVSTLCVLASWRTFGRTTTIPRFASDEGRAKVEARRERAIEQRPHRPRGRRVDLDGDGLRRRLHAREPAGLGGRAAGGGRPGAVGGPGVGDVARRRAPRRAGRGRDPRGRPGRPRAGPRRSAVGPDRALAGLARELGGR